MFQKYENTKLHVCSHNWTHLRYEGTLPKSRKGNMKEQEGVSGLALMLLSNLWKPAHVNTHIKLRIWSCFPLLYA